MRKSLQLIQIHIPDPYIFQSLHAKVEMSRVRNIFNFPL